MILIDSAWRPPTRGWRGLKIPGTKALGACAFVVLMATAWAFAPPAAAQATMATVDAAPDNSTARKAPASKRKAKTTRRAKATPIGREETQAERDRRLKRECQGRPNAGACLGYTR